MRSVRKGPSILSAMVRYWNSLPVSQTRQRGLPPRLLPLLPVGGSVLDVGSGSGEIARLFVQPGQAASVTGVDVLIQPDAKIPVVPFDGVVLPFADRSFDMVTLIDVLHHTDDPAVLLAEAMRVSRGQVLVKDHYWETRLDHWVLSLADYLGNQPYGIALPYHFLRMEHWATLFAALGLTPVRTEQFRYAAHDHAKQVVFVLERRDGQS